MTTPDAAGAQRERVFALALLVSGLVIAIGSVLTWVKITSVVGDSLTESGLDGDGVITVVIGLGIGAIALLAITGRSSRKWVITALVLAVLSLLVAIIDIADVSSADDGVAGLVTASVGIGLWLVLVGSIAALVDAIALLVVGTSSKAEEGADEAAA